MALTNLSTTITLLDIVKQIQKLTLLDSKKNRVNHVLIHLNAQTIKETIKLTPINAPFGNTASTENGIPKNIKKFMKTEYNQFIQP